MAIDSRNKRASCLGVALAGRMVFPNPDGSIAALADRQQVAYAYPGIAATTQTEPTILGDLTTEFAFYVDELKDANPAAEDVTTLVSNDEATARATASTELDDYNTMYAEYLS